VSRLKNFRRFNSNPVLSCSTRVSKQHSNIPDCPRWSYDTAVREFSVHRDTLRKRLSAAAIAPGVDGCYATIDIVTALFGNLHAERIRKTRAEATHVELLNSKISKESLPADEVYRCWESVMLIIKNEIWSSPLPEDTKRSILSHLAEAELPE
jgi:hypothetical protein